MAEDKWRVLSVARGSRIEILREALTTEGNVQAFENDIKRAKKYASWSQVREAGDETTQELLEGSWLKWGKETTVEHGGCCYFSMFHSLVYQNKYALNYNESICLFLYMHTNLSIYLMVDVCM